MGQNEHSYVDTKFNEFIIFPDTCKCHGTDVLHIESHPDFKDGALLEHPIIGGDYAFHGEAADLVLHPKGYFKKEGMAFTVF